MPIGIYSVKNDMRKILAIPIIRVADLISMRPPVSSNPTVVYDGIGPIALLCSGHVVVCLQRYAGDACRGQHTKGGTHQISPSTVIDN